ncbi:MAG: hypothetical protein Kow0069_36570 [Promethearchaeota archaeon]
MERNIPVGLPRFAAEHLERRGYHHLFDVQVEALGAGLLEGRSMVVCAPSASGKTLLVELAALRALNHSAQKVVYLVPLRALAAEKAVDFRRFLSLKPSDVVATFGDEEVTPRSLREARLVLATYEKFDSYLRAPASNGWLADVGLFVVDEVHNVSDPSRGARLESTIVRFLSARPGAQVLCLSATLANPGVLASWLSSLTRKECALVASTKRPVSLSYQFVVTSSKTAALKAIVRDLLPSQVLVFCRSRKEALLTAASLSEVTKDLMDETDGERLARTAAAFDSDRGLGERLKQLVTSGVGFHHAGLRAHEREAVASLFREGLVRVLCCTTTLESGVNLPADVVVVKDVYRYEVREGEPSGGKRNSNGNDRREFARVPLDASTFHQICGRAGRPGLSSSGRVVVLLDDENQSAHVREKFFDDAEPPKPLFPNVTSHSFDHAEYLEQVLVNVKDDRPTDVSEVESFFSKTLGHHLGLDEGVVPLDAPFNNGARKRLLRKLRGSSTFKLKRQAKFKLVEATRHFVDAEVATPGHGADAGTSPVSPRVSHFCGVNILEGWSCDCASSPASPGEKVPLGPSSFAVPRAPPTCEHLALFFERAAKDHGCREQLDAVLREYFRRVSPVTRLVDLGLLLVRPGGKVEKTVLGKLCTRYHLKPGEMGEFAGHVDQLDEEVSIGDLLDLVASVASRGGRPVSSTTLREALTLLTVNSEGALAGKIKWVTPKDADGRPLHAGDLERVVEDLVRIFRLLSELAEYRGNESLYKHASVLERSFSRLSAELAGEQVAPVELARASEVAARIDGVGVNPRRAAKSGTKPGQSAGEG